MLEIDQKEENRCSTKGERIQNELDVDMWTKQKINLEFHEVINSLKERKNEKKNEKEKLSTGKNNDPLELDNTS
ncbi:hypothetical protein C2G38_2164681 [Gigaspora rosea]|uniref:Uncharacterized protein n=1 Tax=Gigaspora rosea TaxID=44941 RepID=A0A397VY73_9GLOM|nr:hypothetical protein C2G38_2164681 [Gigaspora rosea]